MKNFLKENKELILMEVVAILLWTISVSLIGIELTIIALVTIGVIGMVAFEIIGDIVKSREEKKKAERSKKEEKEIKEIKEELQKRFDTWKFEFVIINNRLIRCVTAGDFKVYGKTHYEVFKNMYLELNKQKEA